MIQVHKGVVFSRFLAKDLLNVERYLAMIICCFCKQMIAQHRRADEEVARQKGAYVRHLSSHGVSVEQAKEIAKNASLHSVKEQKAISSLNQESRWMEARLMWSEGASVNQIALKYNVSEKAMRTRIRRWRALHNWFPKRIVQGEVVQG